MTLRKFINNNHHTTICDEFTTMINLRQATEWINKNLIYCSYAIDLQNKFYEIARDYRIFKRYKNFHYHKDSFSERYSFRDIVRETEREIDFL